MYNKLLNNTGLLGVTCVWVNTLTCAPRTASLRAEAGASARADAARPEAAPANEQNHTREGRKSRQLLTDTDSDDRLKGK